MLSRFHLVPEGNGQTDGQTDRFAISISRVSMLTRDKNVNVKGGRCPLLVWNGVSFIFSNCFLSVRHRTDKILKS